MQNEQSPSKTSQGTSRSLTTSQSSPGVRNLRTPRPFRSTPRPLLEPRAQGPARRPIATCRRSRPTASRWSCWPTSTARPTPRPPSAMGASGVGLFRTEYIYLTHPDVPDEEEQFTAYRDVIEASPNRSVTIRTLDIGGDKTVPYLGHTHQEANPFMGWRSIRLSFEHPGVLRHADCGPSCGPRPMRSEHGGRVRIMFPMITTLEEIRKVRAMVRRACQQLHDEGKPCVEVPAGHDARSAGRGDLDQRHAAARRFRLDRLERPGAVPDGGRPRQSQGQPPLPAARAAGAARCWPP